jgi:hypothetical protein
VCPVTQGWTAPHEQNAGVVCLPGVLWYVSKPKHGCNAPQLLWLPTAVVPADKASAPQASESGVQLILNDIHAVVMELDETLLESSTGATAGHAVV